jgi:hypothetical protein
MEFWNIGPQSCIALKNIMIHGKTATIDPQNLNPNTEVTRLRPLFHSSNIPLFHTGDTKPVSLKAKYFQYVI